MKLQYTSGLESVDWAMVRALFDSVGWTGRTDDEIMGAFKKSSFVRFAIKDGVIVGCGRTVDDGRYYGWIVDLAVAPAFQRCGIGTQILEELSSEMHGFRNIALVASSEVVDFYRRNGWVDQVDQTMRLDREKRANSSKAEAGDGDRGESGHQSGRS